MNWQSRPREVNNLFNPAFCGEIIRRSVYAYNSSSNKLFPFPLIFLVLPLVLDKATRERLPKIVKSNMHFLSWLQSNQTIRVQFPQRAKEMALFTKEAFLFLIANNALDIDPEGGLDTKQYQPVKIFGGDTEEINECFKKAENIGKWFSELNNPTLLYMSLDVMTCPNFYYRSKVEFWDHITAGRDSLEFSKFQRAAYSRGVA